MEIVEAESCLSKAMFVLGNSQQRWVWKQTHMLETIWKCSLGTKLPEALSECYLGQ